MIYLDGCEAEVWPALGQVGAGEGGAGHDVGGPRHLLALSLDPLVVSHLHTSQYLQLFRKYI